MASEQVVIDIIANDKALSILENVRGKLIEINSLSKQVSQAISKGVGGINTPKITPDLSGIPNARDQINHIRHSINSNLKDIDISGIEKAEETTGNLGNKFSDAGEKAKTATDKMSKGGVQSATSFHQLNNLLESIGGKFTDLSVKIAGLFGTNSFVGMIEKMWQGAADRQTNMLYLIHQKGVAEANAYYDEIMDIVARLPGDDTFLTNILNMASGLDKNIKVDNLKELGSAITDFYIASTMKGELPFETERDIRKYITTGDTRGLRNSLIASEIDLLKNKNTVLERSEALQKALEKTGFTGISEYESATNELEEFKGHFQKAFADLGAIVIAVTQPLLKFYNALDTIFGSRLSQLIILVGTAFIGLFAVIGGGMIITAVFFRSFEILGFALQSFTTIAKYASASQSFLNAVLMTALGIEVDYETAKRISVLTDLRKIKTTYGLILAKKLNAIATGEETFSVWGLITATGSLVKSKILKIAITIKEIIFGVDSVAVKNAENLVEWESLGVKIDDALLTKALNTLTIEAIHTRIVNIGTYIKENLIIILNTIATAKKNDITLKEAVVNLISAKTEDSKTISTIRNTISKARETIQEAWNIVVKLVGIAISVLRGKTTLSEALAHEFDAFAKITDTEATLSLAGATAILEAVSLPLLLVIGAIVLLVIGLAIAVEKVGEAFGWWKDSGEALSKTLNTLIKIMFPLLGIVETIGEALGWWKDFGSMFEAIGDGIKRLWNAFRLSEPVQGIMQYFGDFIATIQDVIGSILDLFGALFGWEDTGETFDIVQMIINAFGKLGEIIKWVWNLMDDFSNSPLGILTWLNPITILIFHLDELGSFFEDVRDAIDRFTESAEFQDLINAFNEVFTELQEPFQEIWDLINEIIGLFGEIFSADDPEGQGTEDRINFLVEILKGVAYVIKVVVIPAIKLLVAIIKIVTLPIRVILTVIRDIIKAVSQATSLLDIFGIAWQILTLPLTLVQKLLEGIGDVINTVSDAIKNSIIGKLLGWDKESDEENNPESKKEFARNTLYDSMKEGVGASDMDIVTKHQILGELDSQKNSNNVNNIRNLGSTYDNRNNNNGNIIVNQNFNEGSMPIDARNMTKKDVRKLFVGAFGYRRAVGSKGILR